MAEFLANILRPRVFQIGASFICAAVLVTNVDITSLVVRDQPLLPTQTSTPQIQITTMKPSSTLSMRVMEPVRVSEYEPTTSFLEPSPVKTIYVFDYILNQPTSETPRPKPSVKPPRRPFETNSIPKEEWTARYALPRPPYMDKNSRADRGFDGASYSKNQPLPKNNLMPQFFQDVLFGAQAHVIGVLSHMQEHIFGKLGSVAPQVGLVAWMHTRYGQYLRGIPTTEYFKTSALRLACNTGAKEREINRLLTVQGQLESAVLRVLDAGEAIVDGRLAANQKAANEIALLQSMIEEGRLALTTEQGASKLLRQQLGQARDEAGRLGKENESLRAALRKASNDRTREVRRLTDVAIEKNAATSQRRKADKATIEGLEKRSAADAKTILELRKEVKSIGPKDEALACMAGDVRKLKKIINDLEKEARDLTKEKDRAFNDSFDARAGIKAIIVQLNAQVDEANGLLKAAETKLSEQEAWIADAAEQRELAEERASKQETRAAEAEASCKAAEGNIASVKADSDSSHQELQGRLNTATEANARTEVSLDQARADAQEAKVKANEAEKALQERIATLEGQHHGKPVGLGVPALSSDASSQELSTLGQSRPVIRLPVCPKLDSRPHYSAEQRSVCRQIPLLGQSLVDKGEEGWEEVAALWMMTQTKWDINDID